MSLFWSQYDCVCFLSSLSCVVDPDPIGSVFRSFLDPVPDPHMQILDKMEEKYVRFKILINNSEL